MYYLQTSKFARPIRVDDLERREGSGVVSPAIGYSTPEYFVEAIDSLTIVGCGEFALPNT